MPIFGATFFLPIDESSGENDDSDLSKKFVYWLCIQCGEVYTTKEKFKCNHNSFIRIQKQEESEEREDQIPRCSTCSYQAPDPVREVIHGTDGPHAVIATTLYQELPESRKKILAFADGRQEAAFFAWYLENSYKDLLRP